MNDISQVRKRIKNRRNNEFIGEEKKQTHHIFKGFYHLIMLFMGVCMIALIVLLNQKLDLIEMPAYLQNFKIDNLASWLPFENWFSLHEEAVSATPSYTLLKENHYANGSNIAYAPYDSIVLHVQQKSEDNTSITIQQDNGVVTTIGHLSEVSLKQEERILKGKPIGTYQSYITMDFLKNKQVIDLNKALQTSEN